MTREDMSPARLRGQSLKINLPDGAAQSRPPTAAVFLIYFDPKAGYTIAWSRSIQGVDLEGVVEFKSLPSGLHNVKEDLIYFVHEQYAGLSAFVNEAADASERNALMLAVGVLVPLRYGRLGRSWRHAQDLKDLASLLAQDTNNTQPLEDYWESHRLLEDDSSTQPDSPTSSPSGLKLKPVQRQFSSEHARNRTISDATALEPPGQTLSPFHPALSLPEFIDTFGPLIFPLYRAALLRKRILLIGQAPVQLNCNYVYDLSIISNIPIPVQNLLSIEAFSVRLRPLFAIGVHDIPLLEQKARGNDNNEADGRLNDDEVSELDDSGWVACSTDDVLAMKPTLYDVLVTMPPAYSKQAKEKIWPTVESPRGTAVKATQRDLRRYKTLRRGLRRYQSDDIHESPDGDNGNEDVSLLAPRSEETFDDDSSTSDERLIEPMSWPALAYTSFMWWASAGEKRADLDEEVERDAALLNDHWASNASPSERPRPSPKSNLGPNEESPNSVMSEMALIAYFHRLTTLTLSTLADVVDCSDADAGPNGDEEVLTYPTSKELYSDPKFTNGQASTKETADFVVKVETKFSLMGQSGPAQLPAKCPFLYRKVYLRMAPPGRRRPSALVRIISLLFLFSSTASAASAVLGIDLGTEYLKAVLVKPGIPLEIVLTKDSKRKETAALAFKPSNSDPADSDSFPERVYGGDAIALAARFPGDVYSNLKPLLGRVAKDSQVGEYKARHPGQRVIEDKLRGTVAFRSGSFGREVDPFSVEELLAMELRNLRGNAEALAGKGSVVQDAVITIPTYYTAEERRAVELAADLAGLRVLALMSDGLAVGLNYATSRTFPSVNEGGSAEYHLVYDVGAGSARATILRFQGRTVKDVGKFNKTVQEVNIMGVGWDRQLGGDALNAVIVDDMVNQFIDTKKMITLGTTAAHVKEHGRTMAKLWKEAERLRQVLSANTETSASFEGLFYEDANFKYKLSRADFEKHASSYADRVKGPITQALAAAKLTITDLESVILHGGAVRTPFVQKQLEAIVGDPGKLRTNVNADEAAVFGAAFKAAGLSPSFRVKDIRAGDSAGYTVGWSIENKDRNQMLFTPSSQTGPEKQVPFRNVEDFSFILYQQISDQDLDEGVKRPLLKVQTENLTASVAQLSERFGCTAADINTKFSIRLSPIDGLPEVTEGSVSCETEGPEKKGGVVDGVKGLFGFGSKKGDQEPLQEGSETQDASPASSAESSTTSSPTESQTANPEGKSGEETKQPKKRTETVQLKFATESRGINPVSKSELKRIKDRLAAFDASDRSRLLREEAFNTLESYTYRARDLLSDESFISASTDESRKEIEEKFRAASDWLYGSGADANRDDLKARLKELRSLVDPVLKRKDEAVKRPEQIRLLKEALDQTRTLIGVVKEQNEKAASASSTSSTSSSPESHTTTAPPSSSVDDFADLEEEPSTTSTTTQASKVPEMPLYTVEDLEVLIKTHGTIHHWLTTKLAEQEKLAPYEDPVMLSADMEAKVKQLNRVVMELLQKRIRMPPKAKASSKPKTAKKNKKSKTTSANKETPTGSGEVPNIKVGEGGEMPTEEEILEMIEKRKAKEKGEVHDEL